MRHAIEIRRFDKGDIPFGMQLKKLAGWNQLPADWRRFLEWEPQGCFLALYDGQPAGTATTIAYERLFGWIGMILVHPERRRRGIGTALLEAAIAYLEGTRGVAAVKLDATPLGKKLYDTIGFVDEYMLWRWEGRGRCGAMPRDVRELTPADLEAVCALDRPIFGADRTRVLHRFLTEPTIRVAGVWDEEKLLGYAALRAGSQALYFGPCIATEPTVAEKLWHWALRLAGDAPVFVDLLTPCEAAQTLAEQAGFQRQRELIRMYRGNNLSPGRPELQYAILGPETG